MKLKEVENEDREYDGKVMVENIRLLHNHPLAKTPTVTNQMECHKHKDETVMELVDELNTSNVPINCTINMLSEMHGGEQNVPLTARDIGNR